MENKKIKVATCDICQARVKYVFTKNVLGNKVKYYQCQECQYLRTEQPTWLTQAYTSPINIEDTGLVSRNLGLSRLTTIIISLWYDRGGKFLDYSGGYGLFTRLMRDIGLDYYWSDPYVPNVLAQGFEKPSKIKRYELVTAYEVMEHFENPVKEVKKILKYSSNFLFTTELIPSNDPSVMSRWDYLGISHGQHISFYTEKSLRVLANQYGLHYYTDHQLVHLFTKRIISPFIFQNIIRFRSALHPIFQHLYKSKKLTDHIYLTTHK